MAPSWRIAIGCDEAGLSYKAIKNDFQRDGRVRDIVDVGSQTPTDQTPYPLRAAAAARIVADGTVDRAPLICGTGLGMAIAANKVTGVRAVTAHDSFSVERGVRSNNAQVLCMGEPVIGRELARRLATEWLSYEFDETGASAMKVEEIKRLEGSGLRELNGNARNMAVKMPQPVPLNSVG